MTPSDQHRVAAPPGRPATAISLVRSCGMRGLGRRPSTSPRGARTAAPAGGAGRGSGCRSARPARRRDRRRRRGERRRSTRAASWTPAGWRRARRSQRTRRWRRGPGRVAGARQVGVDPAHQVVRRRRDRNRVVGQVEALCGDALGEVGEPRADVLGVEVGEASGTPGALRPACGRSPGRPRLAGPARASGWTSGMNRSPVLVDQVGALAANCFGDQERPLADGQGGGVELDELHVAERCPGAVGDRDAVAESARWVRRAGEQRACSAGRHQRHPGSNRPQLVVAEEPCARRSRAPSAISSTTAVCSSTLDARVIRAPGDQRLRDHRTRGAAAGVQDPSPAVAALAAQRVGCRPARGRTRRPCAPGRRSGRCPR